MESLNSVWQADGYGVFLQALDGNEVMEGSL